MQRYYRRRRRRVLACGSFIEFTLPKRLKQPKINTKVIFLILAHILKLKNSPVSELYYGVINSSRVCLLVFNWYRTPHPLQKFFTILFIAHTVQFDQGLTLRINTCNDTANMIELHSSDQFLASGQSNFLCETRNQHLPAAHFI